jgi:hypothetical protein
VWSLRFDFEHGAAELLTGIMAPALEQPSRPLLLCTHVAISRVDLTILAAIIACNHLMILLRLHRASRYF